MDEVKYKLKSNNVMIVSEAISLLLKSLMKAMHENKNSGLVDQYLHLLHEKCVSSDPLISSVACSGILKLIESNALDVNTALSTTMTLLLTVKTYSGIVTILSGILVESVLYDMQVTKGKYECQWKIINPIHPLILVIEQKYESVKEVINKMDSMCSSDSRVHDHAIELLRPVFLWILCNKKESFSLLDQSDALNVILNYKDTPEKMDLLFECLLWQDISKSDILSCYQFYTLMLKWIKSKNNQRFVWGLMTNFASIAHEVILAGENPKPCFKVLHDLLESCDDPAIISCVLGLLSETTLSCPVSHMKDLLSLCYLYCKKNTCQLVDYMFFAAILQWEYNKNFLTQDFDMMLREIVDFITNKSYENSTYLESDNEFFGVFRSINSRIYNISKFCSQYKRMIENENETSIWMERWEQVYPNSKIECQLFIQAMLLLPNHISDDQKVILYRMAVELVNYDNNIAIGQLPITLYCLKESSSSKLTVELVKSIPVLSSVMENVSTIINTLKNLSSSGIIPKSFLIELYTILYHYQNRCYSFLQNIIAESLCEVQDPKFKWEILISQAKAVKYICETGAASHGMSLIPVVTETIKQSQQNDCPIACCLSLDSLKILLQSQIIDPVSTWQVLSLQFHDEENDSVKISLCNLISVAPSLYQNEPALYDFMDRILHKLWQYTDEVHGCAVNNAAFEALSHFNVETLSYKHVPEKYREGVTIPANMLKINPEENPKPEDVLDHIPSIVWSNLFKYANNKIIPGIVQVCYAMMNREISGYRSGIYEITMVEPNSAKCLPNSSVVRGVLEYLRKEILTITNDISNTFIVDCIKCLSMQFEKPLPPLNWSFIVNLIYNEDLILSFDDRLTAMRFLGKLSENSPSAKKLLTTYLESLRGIYKIEDLQILSEILPHALKSVKSTTFSPVIENCFKQYFNMLLMNNENHNIHVNLLNSVSLCLNSEEIKETTKEALYKFLLDFWRNIDKNNKIWPEIVEVYCSLPYDMIKKILDLVDEKSYDLYKKLAMDYEHSENPLDCLHELIDFGIINISEIDNILDVLLKVLLNTKIDLVCTKTWVLRLKSRIEVYVNSIEARADSAHFLTDLMFMCVIIFSQHFELSFHNAEQFLKLPSNRCSLFPLALRSLMMKSEEWKNVACLLMEWLHISRENGLLNDEYRKAINRALLICVPCANFEEPYIWAKYASTKISGIFPIV